jgi:hypothetical protein
LYFKLAESESKVTWASVPREYTIGNPPASPGFCVTKITDDVAAYEADVALLMLPEKNDAVRAYEAVATYEAVLAYEADVALLMLPEKNEAVRAKDAVFAFKAINAMSALVIVPIRLIICYKYQSLYSW